MINFFYFFDIVSWLVWIPLQSGILWETFLCKISKAVFSLKKYAEKYIAVIVNLASLPRLTSQECLAILLLNS